jgi:hypothetical protein
MSVRLKLGATLAQTPAAKPSSVRGEIISLDGDVMKVHRRGGDTVSIKVEPALCVSVLFEPFRPRACGLILGGNFARMAHG